MPTVSNTSPIFNLACIGRLNLLHEQFGDIWFPQAVEAELSNIPDATVRELVEQARRAGWLRVRAPSDANLVSLLIVDLHQGEAEAIALALEIQADQLQIDEREGRTLARQLGVPVAGVLGILLRARQMGRLQLIKPEIEALKAKAGFFVAPDLEAAILATAGEQFDCRKTVAEPYLLT